MKFSLTHPSLLAVSFLLSLSSAAPKYTNKTGNDYLPDVSVSVSVGGASGYQNAAYYVNWAIYGRGFQPQQIPTTKLTHVMYAFANVIANGTISLTDPWADVQIKSPTDSLNETGTNMYGNLKQLYLHKQSNRGMKTLLSIGGWTLSKHFSAAASTPHTRANFAKTAVSMVQNYGFDGIDIDWEYPETEADQANFVLLLKATRKALDAYAKKFVPGYHFLLTVAVSANPGRIAAMRVKEMDKYLDNWYLMAYDYSGSWDTIAGNNANVFPSLSNNASTPFSTDRAVQGYLAGGVPSHKLVLGMPIYGRSFQKTGGMGMPFNGTGAGDWEAGVWDYKNLPKAGAKEFVDKQAISSWSYDNVTRELISYDTPAVTVLKGKYVKSKGLGGGMWWETSSDKVGEKSLISTMARTLGKLEGSKNNLKYPASMYDNLRADMH